MASADSRPLAGKNGLWHRTTLQAAQEHQHQEYRSTSHVGHKRSYDGKQIHPPPALQPRDPSSQPHLASALPRQLPRLTPSAVKTVGEQAGNPTTEYSQRRAICATPTSTRDPLLSLSHPIYGLPPQLVNNFASMGIGAIYPWQKQCLLGPGLLDGEKNLVYSAPTGGGKSLVADLLTLKLVIRDKAAKALLVLPFVALVQEKVRWLRNLVQGIVRPAAVAPTDGKLWQNRADADTVRIVPFLGGNKIRATWRDFDIGVCTIEKVCWFLHASCRNISGERS